MSLKSELIIVGGGAAGLSAAQYGARANLDTLVLEEMAPGGQALLIDSLENYPGILEPVSGYDFAEIMRAQAERFGARFETASVISLGRDREDFVLGTSEGEARAQAVIIATGAKHRHLGVPGEERLAGRGVSYCATCDGPFFKGRRILVVGGGDAACDEAMYLAKLSDKVTMIHRKDRFRAQKALAERVLGNRSIEVVFDTVAEEIGGQNKVEFVRLLNLKSGERLERAFDAVFVFVGSDPNTSMLPPSILDDSRSVITDFRMATSIPGLFAAGDVRASFFRQVVTSCAEGAIAAHAVSQYLDEIRGAAYR